MAEQVRSSSPIRIRNAKTAGPAFRVPVHDVRHAYRRVKAAAVATGHDPDTEGFTPQQAQGLLQCPVFQDVTHTTVTLGEKCHGISVTGQRPHTWAVALQCWPCDMDEEDRAEQAAATSVYAAGRKAIMQQAVDAKEDEVTEQRAQSTPLDEDGQATVAAELNANGASAAVLESYNPFPQAVWKRKPTEEAREAAVAKYCAGGRDHVALARTMTRRGLRPMDVVPVLMSTEALNHGAYGCKAGAKGWHYAETDDMEGRGFFSPRTQPDYQTVHLRLVTARGQVTDYRVSAAFPLLPPDRHGVPSKSDHETLKYLLSVIVAGWNDLYTNSKNCPEKYEEHAALVFPVILAGLVKEGWRAALEEPESQEAAAAHMNMWLTMFPQVLLTLQAYMNTLPRINWYLQRDLLAFLSHPTRSHKRWPSLTEAVAAAYLCGLPWNLVRRAAWLRLLGDMVYKTQGMAQTSLGTFKQLQHGFQQTLDEWQRILMLGGLTWSKSFEAAFRELQRERGMYTQAQRVAFAKQLTEIRGLSREDMTEAMQLLGLGTGSMSRRDLRELAMSLFTKMEAVLSKRRRDGPDGGDGEVLLEAEPVEVLQRMMRDDATLRMASDYSRRFDTKARQAELDAAHAKLVAQHKGLPQLPVNSVLPDPTCCGFCFRSFPTRDALFVHLRHAGVDTGSAQHVRHAAELRCVNCETQFDSRAALQSHYDETSSPCYRGQPNQQQQSTVEGGGESKTTETEKTKKPVEDNDVECCVCMDAAPDVVFLPCTHQVACGACTCELRQSGGTCPCCRAAIHAQFTVSF